eukprot:1210278-Alexandrium_andersonii.AAC.2
MLRTALPLGDCIGRSSRMCVGRMSLACEPLVGGICPSDGCWHRGCASGRREQCCSSCALIAAHLGWIVACAGLMWASRPQACPSCGGRNVVARCTKK